MYAPLVKSVPRGEYLEVEGTRHDTLWTDRLDAVVQAVRDLLALSTASATR